MRRRDLICGGLAALLARPVAAHAHRLGGPAFGSSWRATIEKSVDADLVRKTIEGVITGVDARLSPYRSDSALSAFNASARLDWSVVDPMLETLARDAMRVARDTDGSFDPTVGPLVARQGFGPIFGRIDRTAKVEVGVQGLRKTSPDATLDLCGIAKGYALDRIMVELQGLGVRSAIVDVGGEVKSLGSHPAGRPWTVAVADPFAPGHARHVVALRGRALATSGHSAQGVRGRVDASHIIDPHRRGPALQTLRSVSVLHPSATEADALATAFCAAGPEAGPGLARRMGAEALFISDTADTFTGGFESHVLV